MALLMPLVFAPGERRYAQPGAAIPRAPRRGGRSRGPCDTR